MKKFIYTIVAATGAIALSGVSKSSAKATDNASAAVVVETDAYCWAGDTLYQDEFKAWAVSPEEIRSTYKGRPGYGFPIAQQWKRRNDLSQYPVLSEPNALLQAVYNMGLDEMVNAVEPDSTLRTGKEWAGVWTRDVSYSIILSMAALQPEVSMISLMKKVNPEGQIVQDTGSGGAWPISTDRMIWVLAAYEVYKVTGYKKWLETVYPIAERSIAKDAGSIVSENGLVKGETSFIDWREQSYPRWMQTADIAESEAMNTNVLYAAALNAMSDMASRLGKKKEAAAYAQRATDMAEAIEREFAIDGKGYWGMYTYGRQNKILNPRAETLGESLAILYDVASPERQKEISEGNPVTPYGPAIFYPQIADMPNYHNNALWPFVASYWALAQAKAGNEAGVVEGIGSVVRPAALFATNKENFNLDNGDIFTELNSSNMLWSLSGNLALTNRILFGIHFEPDGLRIAPFVPEVFRGTRKLENFPYRGERLNITVEGYGDSVSELYLNGRKMNPSEILTARQLSKGGDIRVVMDNEPIPAMQLNRVANSKAPLTPVTWLERDVERCSMNTPELNVLRWNPIEYIAGYIILKDGREVGRTRRTNWPLDDFGEWQVIGISGDGVEGFASEPRSNRRSENLKPQSALSAILSSDEVSYQPETPVEGFTGDGFVEIDRSTGPVVFSFESHEPDEEIFATIRYANGNGPVNTENKAAVRSLYVDGVKVGTVVMPQRGVANWDDWGYSGTVKFKVAPGRHTVTLRYDPDTDSNMNIDTNHALVDILHLERR